MTNTVSRIYSFWNAVAQYLNVLYPCHGERDITKRNWEEEEASSLSVDFARNEILLGEKPVKLTSTERKLLYHLIRNEGRILSHESLLAKVWGETYIDARDLLRVHIQHLRNKLGDNTESSNIIVTEHGMGYKFVRPSST